MQPSITSRDGKAGTARATAAAGRELGSFEVLAGHRLKGPAGLPGRKGRVPNPARHFQVTNNLVCLTINLNQQMSRRTGEISVRARKTTRDLRHPTRRMPFPTRWMRHPTRRLRHPTRRLSHPTIGMHHPTRRLSHPTRWMQNPTRRLRHPTRCLQHPTRRLCHPTRRLQHPTSSLLKYSRLA